MNADRKFLFEYHFGGSTWGITIHATDPTEAREKIKAVGMARYVGEPVITIPAYRGAVFLAWLSAWWRGR